MNYEMEYGFKNGPRIEAAVLRRWGSKPEADYWQETEPQLFQGYGIGYGDAIDRSARGEALASEGMSDGWRGVWSLAALASSGAGAYHGYLRNNGSIGYAVLWAVLGGMFPVVVPAIAYAQGFGKPEAVAPPAKTAAGSCGVSTSGDSWNYVWYMNDGSTQGNGVTVPNDNVASADVAATGGDPPSFFFPVVSPSAFSKVVRVRVSDGCTVSLTPGYSQ